jgi:hypothetical protein
MLPTYRNLCLSSIANPRAGLAFLQSCLEGNLFRPTRSPRTAGSLLANSRSRRRKIRTLHQMCKAPDNRASSTKSGFIRSVPLLLPGNRLDGRVSSRRIHQKVSIPNKTQEILSEKRNLAATAAGSPNPWPRCLALAWLTVANSGSSDAARQCNCQMCLAKTPSEVGWDARFFNDLRLVAESKWSTSFAPAVAPLDGCIVSPGALYSHNGRALTLIGCSIFFFGTQDV